MVEEFIMLVMKVVTKGKYEKLNNVYSFEPNVGKYIIIVSDRSIEFKIKTLKWIPGAYEPIEGSEVFNSVSYDEMKALNEQERLGVIASIVSKLKNID